LILFFYFSCQYVNNHMAYITKWGTIRKFSMKKGAETWFCSIWTYESRVLNFNIFLIQKFTKVWKMSLGEHMGWFYKLKVMVFKNTCYSSEDEVENSTRSLKSKILGSWSHPCLQQGQNDVVNIIKKIEMFPTINV